MKKDWCTCFFDNWFRWGYGMRVEKFYIGNICKNHDDTLSATGFIMELWNNRVVGSLIIGIVAVVATWILYPLRMIKRV